MTEQKGSFSSINNFFEQSQKANPKPYPWMVNGKNFELVTSLEHFKEVIDKAIESGHCALDLETTGLDNRIDRTGRTVHDIVGYCLCFDGETGYYVPIEHKLKDGSKHPANIHYTEANPEIKRLCENCVTIYHNSAFDLEFLYGSNEHIDIDSGSQFEDTLILDYLKDSTEKRHGLKYLSKEYLGMEMLELKQLFGPGEKNRDFSTLDPTDQATLWYAGADAICTYLLWEHLRWYGEKEQKAAYQIEKALIPALRWMERNRMRVDLSYARRLEEEVENLIKATINEIYAELATAMDLREKEVRHRYDVKSPQQLGQAFQELHKTNRSFAQIKLERTEKSKQIRTDAASIEKMAEDYGDRFPFLAKIQIFRSLQKVRGTYIRPLVENTDEDQVLKDSTIRFRFLPHRVDTGRFAAAKGKADQGFSGINVQSMPATYSYAKFPVKKILMRPDGVGDENAILDADYTSAADQGFLKWVYEGHFIRENRNGQEFCIRATCEGCPFEESCAHEEPVKKKFFSLENAIRPALVAREGYVLTAIDYAGLELRAVASICEEPRWIEEFYRCGGCGHEFEKPVKLPNGRWEVKEVPSTLCPSCGSDKIGDLHTLTAKLIYGDNVTSLPSSDFKQRRQNAKSSNFAIIYGGGGNAVARATGVEPSEGWDILRRILDGLPKFKGWKEQVIKDAHQNREVTTAVGRRIRLRDINHAEKWIRAKQERNAVNSIVQGSATGDLIKYAMNRVYREVKERNWWDICRMLLTIHDELVFEIRQDMLDEVLPVINECMTEFAQRVHWPIPLVTDVEFAKEWAPEYNWNMMRAVDKSTGFAQEPVPLFLISDIRFHKGMWFEGESGEKRIYDGSDFVSEEDFKEALAMSLTEHSPDESGELKASVDENPSKDSGKTSDSELSDETPTESPVDLPGQPKKSSKPLPDLPTYVHTTHVALNNRMLLTSYLGRLRRVLESCRMMAKLKMITPTHILRVKTVEGKNLLPESDISLVDPHIFSIFAFYEGL